MTVFLTSSPTGPLDQSRAVDGLDGKNRFAENLGRRWREGSRCLIVSAFPEEAERNDEMRAFMARALGRSGLSCSAFDVWDRRTDDVSAQALRAYDAVFLGGGHVPTQNAYFHALGLREKLDGFPGLLIGISAGSMNSADVVYAQPELPGEASDPGYTRFLEGLGLTKINLLPHYQMVKDFTLDGKRLFEEITYPDSAGRSFLAIPDGSYLLIENGVTTLFGEGYRIADGRRERLCGEDETVVL